MSRKELTDYRFFSPAFFLGYVPAAKLLYLALGVAFG